LRKKEPEKAIFFWIDALPFDLNVEALHRKGCDVSVHAVLNDTTGMFRKVVP
jgi:hypothetical protein